MSLEPSSSNLNQDPTPNRGIGDLSKYLLIAAGAIVGALISEDATGAVIGGGGGVLLTAIGNRLVRN